jgi:hypothetical protein
MEFSLVLFSKQVISFKGHLSTILFEISTFFQEKHKNAQADELALISMSFFTSSQLLERHL